jgi:hypothetical protein
MRLFVSLFILLITLLDIYVGRPDPMLHIAGAIAGVLLAATVVVDAVWLGRRSTHASAETPTTEAGDDRSRKGLT